MKWPIFERFRALSSPNVVWFCWNLHQLLLKKSKTLLLEFFWNSIFYRKRTFPKFALFFSFCPTLRPFFSMKEAGIEKSKNFVEKTTPSGYPKFAKSRPYLVPIFQKKYDYFLSRFGRFLVKKWAWSHLQARNQNVT